MLRARDKLIYKSHHTKFCGGFLWQPVIVNISVLLCTHLNYWLSSWFLALYKKEND